MSASKAAFRLGLKGKVLFAVMTFLIIVPLLILWIVTRETRSQVEGAAVASIRSANDSFAKLLQNRDQLVIARYRALGTDARVEATFENPDIGSQVLGDVLSKGPREDEGFAVMDLTGKVVASIVRPDSVFEPHQLASVGPSAAPRAVLRVINDRIFSVVSVPAMSRIDPSKVAGTLVGAVAFTDATLGDFQPAGTTALLVSGGKIVAASGEARTFPPDVLSRLAANPPVSPEHLEVAGRNYMAYAAPLDASAAANAIQPILLASYQEQLTALENTQSDILKLSIAGIVVSALVVFWFVGRLMQPLRDLASSAEAVGRGDFSHRIERVSGDECGEVAVAFNRMTSNLEGSRAELQKTVETLRNTQSQLIQSEKLSAVGQFVAGVAHELNNPLTAVIGFSDLLSQTATETKIRPHLELIAKSAHRCHKIVQSLLSFARQHPPERKLIRINDTIDEVLEIMAYDFRTSNIAVERAFSPDLPAIMADPHQLQQVFVNILSNARQAIEPFRPDGRIVVSTLAVGAMVRIVIADNGPGIRPENLSRIFDPFFTTKPVGKGTGLGMSLSYGIVNEHGGKISVASEPGEGASFLIELPVAANGKGLSATQAIRSGNSRPPIPGKSVLVVDDEEWILALSQALLEEDGYEVVTVTSGEAAVGVLEKRGFDVIVSDWKMPGMNGIQLYEHLRTRNVVAASRMIFMTGDVISDTFQEFLSRQAKGCLTKPFAIGEFRSAVNAMAAAANA